MTEPSAGPGEHGPAPLTPSLVRRFRFTLLAICLLLLVLGGLDVHEALLNPEPRPTSIGELEQGEPPRAWLTVEGGELDLAEAISTSGSLELEALLVPLRAPGRTGPLRALVEIRDPAALGLFRTLHFGHDTEAAQAAWARDHADELRRRGPVTALVLGGIGARSNRADLRKLARDAGLEVDERVVFLIEGKQPSPLRGGAFLLLGLGAAIKVGLGWCAGRRRAA